MVVGSVTSYSTCEHSVRLLQLRSEVYITDRVMLFAAAIAINSSVCAVVRPPVTRWSVGAPDSYWSLVQGDNGVQTKFDVPACAIFEIYELLSHKLDAVHDRSEVVVAAVTSYSKPEQALLTGVQVRSAPSVKATLMYSPAVQVRLGVHTRLAMAKFQWGASTSSGPY